VITLTVNIWWFRLCCTDQHIGVSTEIRTCCDQVWSLTVLRP